MIVVKQEDMEKRIRQRLEIQQSCQQQMAFKELRRQAEKEEEEAFRQMMMAKFAEDDRIEQMNAQKRRMKQLEHKRAVEKLMEDRRNQYLADKVTCSDRGLMIQRSAEQQNTILNVYAIHRNARLRREPSTSRGKTYAGRSLRRRDRSSSNSMPLNCWVIFLR